MPDQPEALDENMTKYYTVYSKLMDISPMTSSVIYTLMTLFNRK